ncbi:MAG: right-handed parallel beta-helix repeat-containing protein [Muribaculaceae bacterium]|nr:right-handed parallel beta-helix repeat-containing protein [Muribaculaceae bacterium]
MKAKALLSVACIGLGAIFASAETINVRTAEEFVKALGPDRTIAIDTETPLVITPVITDMATAKQLQVYDYYRNDNHFTGLAYYDNFDGPALAVVGYPNLTITGNGDIRPTILSQPRYADVLTFDNCANLVLDNVVMGHTEEGYCEGAVVSIINCYGVNVRGCDLFGCGTEGFIIKNSVNISVLNTTVHDCSYHTMHLQGCENVSFNSCTFCDNREFSQINIRECNNVDFTYCTFSNLKGELFNVSSETLFNGCTISNCEYNPSEYTKIVNCNVVGNQQQADYNDEPGYDATLFPPAYPGGTPAECLAGDWVFEDTNTIPATTERISIEPDWSFYVSTQDDAADPSSGFDKIHNYYGKCWEKERLSNNEVIIEYRIDKENTSDDGFKNKNKTIKGKFKVVQVFDNGAYWIVTPLDGLRFGIPKGKSRKFQYQLTLG